MFGTQETIDLIEKRLYDSVPAFENELFSVSDMLRYSLEGGGKRIRPLLCLMFCAAAGGDSEKALAPGCALEFIHTYSLIHDDLPCMDDDDYRRGKLSSHKMWGEAYALLAGDALLTRSFGIITDAALKGEISNEAAIKCVSELSAYAGAKGMIGGQYIDLAYENRQADEKVLFDMDSLKTSALISCACVMGVIIAGGSESHIECARSFGLNLGLAFQIKDDIIEYDNGDLSDEKNGKATYITLLGTDKARVIAEEYTNKAISALELFGENAKDIEMLAKQLLGRNK